MRGLIAPLLLSAVAVSCATSRTPPPSVTAELVAMRDADQEVRKRWIADRENRALQVEVQTVDARNLARLKEIVRRYGWPGASTFGKPAASAAWMIAQHADQDPEFQREMLPKMEAAMKRGDLAPQLYALTVDRVLVGGKKLQRYGSQFDTKEGRCQPLPMEDPEHVDERRKAMGLDPLAEYTQQLCALYNHKK